MIHKLNIHIHLVQNSQIKKLITAGEIKQSIGGYVKEKKNLHNIPTEDILKLISSLSTEIKP